MKNPKQSEKQKEVKETGCYEKGKKGVGGRIISYPLGGLGA